MAAHEVAPQAVLDPATRRAGFAALYDDHVATVYRFVHRRCCDRTMAEDITHDVFLAAVRTQPDPALVSVGWLLRAARNRLIDVLRRKTTYAGKLRLVGGNEGGGEVDVAVAERMRLAAALDELSVDHRLVLALRFLDGLSVDELADELGRSPKGVEALITRARRALRTALDEADV